MTPDAPNLTESHARPGETKRGVWVVRALITFLNLLAIGCVLVLMASFAGRISFWAELISNFRLQLALGALAIFPLVYFVGNRVLGAVLLASVILSLATVFVVFLPVSQREPGKQQLRLMSFNVLAGNHTTETAIDIILEHQPDLVVVAEYANYWVYDLQRLDSLYPHQVLEPRWHGFGMAVFSKFPLEKSSTIQLANDKTDAPMVSTDVNVNGKRIRLAAVHLLAPMSASRMQIRNQQMSEMAAALDSNNEIPLIVAGDLNCVPWSPYLRDLKKALNLQDSRMGFGYHGSWPADFALMRIPIDHILVTEEVHVRNRRTAPAGGSDHFPVVADVSF